MRITLIIIAVLIATGLLFADDAKPSLDRDAALERFGTAETILIGKLLAVRPGPTAMSYPPIHTMQLQVEVQQVLRGEGKVGQKMQITHSVRGQRPPVLPVGRQCAIAADRPVRTNGNMPLRVKYVAAGADVVAQAKWAAGIPIGWKMDKDKLVSPWASIEGYVWHGEKALPKQAHCSKTGRPALLAGAIEFKVEPIIVPEKQIKWTNPDGDGEHRITVTNPTDKPLVVPALLSDDKGIRWDQSLLITCRDRTYTMPGLREAGELKPTTLKPRQSVSTVVNVLSLEGPPWPRGGSRLEFLFSLGEHGQTRSFYYMSRHHDALRGR